MPSPRPRPRWVFPTLGTAPPLGAAPDVTVPSLCSAEGAPGTLATPRGVVPLWTLGGSAQSSGDL